MKSRTLSSLSLAAALLFPIGFAVTAQAAPTVTLSGTVTTFFGLEQAPGGAVSGDPLAARTTFLSRLSGVGSEGFESFGNGAAPPLGLNFAGSNGTTLTANLTGTGTAVFNTPFEGRFNTTAGGTNLLEVDAGGSFNIGFGSAISAFGFYGTDIGDFGAQGLKLTLTKSSGGTVEQVIDLANMASDGNLLFWGFIDDSDTYTNIAFSSLVDLQPDVFGFDDMIIGDQGQIGTPPPTPMPEPASLALVGLSLLALTATRRRRG